MKLDQTDYDNIFFRIRERLLGQFFAITAVVIAIFGVTTWFSAKAKIDEITEVAVNKYVQSDEFQRNVVLTYQEKLARFESQTKEISKLLTEQQYKAAQLSEIPILIDSSGITLINSHGQQFRLEMGVANSGTKIIFKSPYQTTPTVLLSIDSATLDAISIHRLQARGTLVLTANSTPQGFEVPASVDSVRYRWVAFGRQEDIPPYADISDNSTQCLDSER